jgi:aspartyl-tRNA(Asn)/glutamyl-tRNA(Gln) amidotransferase subunit C
MTKPVLSAREVNQIAQLARLRLDPAETEAMARDLASILDHIRELEGVDVESVPPTGGVSEHTAPMRADTAGADPLKLPPETFAPELVDGLFVVPRLAALDADAVMEGGSA